MTMFQPERRTVRLRNASVAAVAGTRVDLFIDGGMVPDVPVYGPLPVAGMGVLVLEQGGSLLVLGSAVTLAAEIADLADRVRLIERRLHGE